MTDEVAVTDYNHEEDVVYGYKDGMGLLMDVYTPRDPRVDAGIIYIAAGGWRGTPEARHEMVSNAETPQIDNVARCLLDAGYVVFAVTHSNQPLYNLDEIRPDVSRAVRFVRYHAARFRLDEERLGIIGSSSGGHISLMTAMAPPDGDSEAEDPVDRVSSRVQAAVAYYPPTDLLNYGAPGVTIQQHLNQYFQDTQNHEWNAPFDFFRFDEIAYRYERVSDPEPRDEIFRRNSPIAHVGGYTPPILLFHGDQDVIVPIQQSEVFCRRLQKVGAVHKLIPFPGLGHEKPPPPHDGRTEIIDWFGRHLGPERG